MAFGCLQFAQCMENNICEKATSEFEKKYERIGFLGFLKSRTEPKPVGLTQFRFDFGFFLKKTGLVVFIGKNRTEPKMITPTL